MSNDGYRPWNLFVDSPNKTVYILTEDIKTNFSDPCVIRVWKTTDLVNITEVFHFTYNTFARSFAVLDGDFYFGVGSEWKDPNNNLSESIKPEVGNFLRVKKEQINN